jgi:hypothetical protein
VWHEGQSGESVTRPSLPGMGASVMRLAGGNGLPRAPLRDHPFDALFSPGAERNGTLTNGNFEGCPATHTLILEEASDLRERGSAGIPNGGLYPNVAFGEHECKVDDADFDDHPSAPRICFVGCADLVVRDRELLPRGWILELSCRGYRLLVRVQRGLDPRLNHHAIPDDELLGFGFGGRRGLFRLLVGESRLLIAVAPTSRGDDANQQQKSHALHSLSILLKEAGRKRRNWGKLTHVPSDWAAGMAALEPQ